MDGLARYPACPALTIQSASKPDASSELVIINSKAVITTTTSTTTHQPSARHPPPPPRPIAFIRPITYPPHLAPPWDPPPARQRPPLTSAYRHARLPAHRPPLHWPACLARPSTPAAAAAPTKHHHHHHHLPPLPSPDPDRHTAF